jgi:hypothetical protein
VIVQALLDEFWTFDTGMEARDPPQTDRAMPESTAPADGDQGASFKGSKQTPVP